MAEKPKKRSEADAHARIKAKFEKVAEIQASKDRKVKALQKRLTEEGLTLRDGDIRVVNVELRMPVSGFLFGQATIRVGGAALPDPPRADSDVVDDVFTDDDPVSWTDADPIPGDPK